MEQVIFYDTRVTLSLRPIAPDALKCQIAEG